MKYGPVYPRPPPGWKRCRWESLHPIAACNARCTTSKVTSPGSRSRRQIRGLEPRSSTVTVNALTCSGGSGSSIGRLPGLYSSTPSRAPSPPPRTCWVRAARSSLLKFATHAFTAAGSVGTGC